MTDELKNKVIKYCGFETKSMQFGTKYKIKDEEGKSYSFFDSKKDGNQTKAYQQFLDLKVGDRVGIAYKEEDGVYNGKQVKYKTIMYFTDARNVSQEAPQSRLPEDDARLDIILSKLDKIIKMIGEPVSDEEMAKEFPLPKEEDITDQIPF